MILQSIEKMAVCFEGCNCAGQACF